MNETRRSDADVVALQASLSEVEMEEWAAHGCSREAFDVILARRDRWEESR